MLRLNAVNAPVAVECGGGRFVVDYLIASHETETDADIARAKERTEREIIALYIADALQIVEQNTAKANGGSAHTKALRDVLEMYRNPRPVETPEQIVNRFLTAFSDGKEGKTD